jgi:hypothetical protein
MYWGCRLCSPTLFVKFSKYAEDDIISADMSVGYLQRTRGSTPEQEWITIQYHDLVESEMSSLDEMANVPKYYNDGQLPPFFVSNYQLKSGTWNGADTTDHAFAQWYKAGQGQTRQKQVVETLKNRAQIPKFKKLRDLGTTLSQSLESSKTWIQTVEKNSETLRKTLGSRTMESIRQDIAQELQLFTSLQEDHQRKFVDWKCKMKDSSNPLVKDVDRFSTRDLSNGPGVVSFGFGDWGYGLGAGHCSETDLKLNRWKKFRNHKELNTALFNRNYVAVTYHINFETTPLVKTLVEGWDSCGRQQSFVEVEFSTSGCPPGQLARPQFVTARNK